MVDPVYSDRLIKYYPDSLRIGCPSEIVCPSELRFLMCNSRVRCYNVFVDSFVPQVQAMSLSGGQLCLTNIRACLGQLGILLSLATFQTQAFQDLKLVKALQKGKC